MSFLEQIEHLRIPFETISLATKGFKTIIGSGGGGDVYIGELPYDGQIIKIAVKRLPGLSLFAPRRNQFLTELQLLSCYKHRNMVPFIGYCDEKEESLLVYEYVEGRSLDYYLNTACPLTWDQRIKICIDVARGLNYCHNDVGRIHELIHRDIKSANILLDRNMKAMIGDFGLAVIAHSYENEDERNVSGTLGYWDPAYIKTGVLTNKSDIYSFGVVLFEVLCGRSCFKDVIGEQRYLVPLARRCYEEGRLKEITDLDLKDSESMKEFSKIAYQCVNDDPERRPSIDLVLQKLQKVLELDELNYEALESQAIVETMEFYEQGDQVSELQDFRIVPTSLTSQVCGVPNDQQLFNQLPSRGSMRPGQRSLINQLEEENVHRGFGQTDVYVDDEKLMSITDFCCRNGISTNQDRDISSAEYDENGQPITVGVVAQDRFSNPSIVIEDPYACDKAFSISDFARQQPSQTRGLLTNKENDVKN